MFFSQRPLNCMVNLDFQAIHIWPGQISIVPKPELKGFWGSSLIKPPFRVTSAEVVIICPDMIWLIPSHSLQSKIKAIPVAVITFLCGWYDHRPQQEDTKRNAKLHHVSIKSTDFKPTKRGRCELHKIFEPKIAIRNDGFFRMLGAGWISPQNMQRLTCWGSVFAPLKHTLNTVHLKRCLDVL